MMQVFIILIIIIFIPTLMLILNFIISKKKIISREKSSPFECGFDPFSEARMPFSTQFFIISLIFLIFDIEIALLLPLIHLSKNFNPFIILYTFIFMFLLLLGLYLEYMEYSLDWKL